MSYHREYDRRRPSYYPSKRKSHGLIIGLLLVCLVIAVGVIVALCLQDSGKEAPQHATSSGMDRGNQGAAQRPVEQTTSRNGEIQKGASDEEAVKALINAWLTAEKNDDDTSRYWEDPKSACHFFAVTKWEIVRNKVAANKLGEATGNSSVRIHSSNRGGMPIVCIWWVFTKKVNGQWKIYFVDKGG